MLTQKCRRWRRRAANKYDRKHVYDFGVWRNRPSSTVAQTNLTNQWVDWTAFHENYRSTQFRELWLPDSGKVLMSLVCLEFPGAGFTFQWEAVMVPRVQINVFFLWFNKRNWGCNGSWTLENCLVGSTYFLGAIFSPCEPLAGYRRCFDIFVQHQPCHPTYILDVVRKGGDVWFVSSQLSRNLFWCAQGSVINAVGIVT